MFMQMMQWLNLLDKLQDKILWLVGEDDWKLHHLVIVAKSWWEKRDGTTQYQQMGTIVLEPKRIPRLLYQPEFGKTYAAVVSLLTHSSVHNISPDQYKYVKRPTEIQSYRPITNQVFGVLLQQIRNNELQLDGQRLCYRNVSKLDLTDSSNWEIDNTVWRSEDMQVPDLFKSKPPMLPTKGTMFAAYLFL